MLEVDGLEVERAGRRILRGVTFAVAAGEVLGLLGPSGAGKSTTFRVVAGELVPAAGRVLIGGEDVTGQPLWRRARRGLGYVPQTPSVLWELTVAQNLDAFFALAGDRAAPGDAVSLAGRVDLASRLDVRAGDLSGGERRRLELGRALVVRPKLLVCDEPFAGVDPQAASALGELLRGLADDGVAVLFADHHVEEALRICHRAALVVDGTLEASCPPDAFREHPTVQGRYLGSWTRSLPPPPPR